MGDRAASVRLWGAHLPARERAGPPRPLGGLPGVSRPAAAGGRKGPPDRGLGPPTRRVGPDVNYGRQGHGRIRERPAGHRRPRLRLPARHPGPLLPPDAGPARLRLDRPAPRPGGRAANAPVAVPTEAHGPAPQLAAPGGAAPAIQCTSTAAPAGDRGWPNTRQAPHHQNRQHPAAARVTALHPTRRAHKAPSGRFPQRSSQRPPHRPPPRPPNCPSRPA